MENEKREKWYQHKGVYLSVTVVTTLFLAMQNFYQGRDNDRLRTEQAEINDRLNAKDAYFNKALIEGAKDREAAYFEMRNRYERMLNHCRTEPDGCNLPNDLTVIPTERQFESLEAILTRK